MLILEPKTYMAIVGARGFKHRVSQNHFREKYRWKVVGPDEVQRWIGRYRELHTAVRRLKQFLCDVDILVGCDNGQGVLAGKINSCDARSFYGPKEWLQKITALACALARE